MDGSEYIAIVRLFFSFLETEFGLNQSSEEVNGNAFYDVEYRDDQKVISISYENIEDHLQVIVFILQNGEMPDYDDKTHTLHLEYLSRLALANVKDSDIASNDERFKEFKPKGELQAKLWKNAKQLRLCLMHTDRSAG
jgi:hypothetical protein